MTGDGAVRERLTDTDLSTVATAQQARSIGISPATAVKLSSLLQWALDELEAANDRHTEDPSSEHNAGLWDCRRRALTARDVARGQRSLDVLGWYRAPLSGHGTELLFTPDEVGQAQSHFDAATTYGLQGTVMNRSAHLRRTTDRTSAAYDSSQAARDWEG